MSKKIDISEEGYFRNCFSWIILDEREVAKKTDKTFFKYKMSGIPKELCYFFNIDKLENGKVQDIKVFYKENEYSAYFYIDPQGRARIVWDNLLKQAIIKNISNNDYPIIKFSKINNKAYALDEVTYINEKQKQYANELSNISDENIYKLAKKYSYQNIKKRKVIIDCVERNPYISEYAKRNAKGYCELCKNKAPFNNKNGEPYLESHHIIWLSQGGIDSIENVVALCPNCHKKMHILNNQHDVEELLSLKSQQIK